MKGNGFVPLRRGLWEHVRNGSLTHTGALIYIYMLSQADTRTGVWKGSAQAVAGELGIPKSTVKHAFRGLDGRYIKRFAIVGKHVCYPILLHKFLITQGQHVGLRLDAINSTSEKTLAFLSENDSQHVDQPVVQPVAPQRIQEKRDRIRKRETDPRFGPFLELAKSAFEAKHRQPPTWDLFGKDGAALAAFLRRAPHVTPELWQTHVSNFFDSTEGFTVKQGGSLSHFISRFDTFSSGPILERQGTNAGKKLTGDDLTTANLKAAGFIQ